MFLNAGSLKTRIYLPMTSAIVTCICIEIKTICLLLYLRSTMKLVHSKNKTENKVLKYFRDSSISIHLIIIELGSLQVALNMHTMEEIIN